MKRILIVLILAALISAPSYVFADDFNLDLGVSYTVEDGITYISLNLQPDIAFGNFGIGLIGQVDFKVLTSAPFVEPDFSSWIPDFTGNTTIMDYVQDVASVYLPIFRYVRYGYKGDPLHIRLGQLDDTTLGTGMFMNSYSNTNFLPDTKLIGAVLDMDGRLFGMPFIGFEAMAGNLSQFDTIGGRVYIRPLSFIDFPIIRDIQIGGSYVTDRVPNLYVTDETFDYALPVSMYGADVIMPIIDIGVFNLTAFGDIGFQPDPTDPASVTKAYRAGVKGKILGFLPYEADLLLPEEGFIQNYFDTSYDSERKQRYDEFDGGGIAGGNYYLHVSSGFDMFKENIVFDLDISSELSYDGTDFSILDPSMLAYLKLGEDLIKIVYFEATYKKTAIATDSVEAFIGDILSPTKNSEIRANVNVKYNVIVVTVGYGIDFDAEGNMTTLTPVFGGTVKLF